MEGAVGKEVEGATVASVSVKGIANPGKALRKHDGRNKDLRRSVIESAPEILQGVVQELRSALEGRLARDDPAIIAALLCMKLQSLPIAACWKIVRAAFDFDLVVCVYCVKGQHRSVAVVEHVVRENLLTGISSAFPYRAHAFHRELQESHAPKSRDKEKRGADRKKKSNHRD